MLSLFEENKGIKEMTKEQLAEEIENKGVEYANSINYTIPKFSDENGYCWGQVEEAYEKGALDFAEPREKRIAELEVQIEKMKCCENCVFFKDKTYDICNRILFLTN